MENKKFNPIWILVILVVGFFAFNMMRTPKSPSKSSDSIPQAVQSTSPATQMETTAPSDEKMTSVKEFTVSGENFSFDVKEMKVKKGDTVKVTFKNVEGFHDWNLDEFNTKTKVIKAGESETVTFVADKTGTFEYYCSVGQHRATGMKGNLIVE
jgi:plastocyanin